MMWVAALLLWVWFTTEMFRPDWYGTGNPRWLILIIAMWLGLAAQRIRPASRKQARS